MRPAALLVVLAAALPGVSAAHHSIAGLYETGRNISVQGRLTLVEVVNPHSRFELDAGGTIWKIESRGVAGMEQRGFDRSAFKVGDRVTVDGAPARDGSKAIWLNKLTSGGRTFESRR
jgi:hypothetical protein